MKLDRNGKSGGKYAVLNMRKVRDEIEKERSYSGGSDPVHLAIQVLENHGLINYGDIGTDREFFVIMLRDCNADVALYAYASAAHRIDPEYALEVQQLATRAGLGSRFCKEPD